MTHEVEISLAIVLSAIFLAAITFTFPLAITLGVVAVVILSAAVFGRESP